MDKLLEYYKMVLNEVYLDSLVSGEYPFISDALHDLLGDIRDKMKEQEYLSTRDDGTGYIKECNQLRQKQEI